MLPPTLDHILSTSHLNNSIVRWYQLSVLAWYSHTYDLALSVEGVFIRSLIFVVLTGFSTYHLLVRPRQSPSSFAPE